MTVDPNCIDLPAFVADGASVTTGHQIAEVGDLGNASGCHHFELHSNAASIYQVPADPTIWLRESVGTPAQPAEPPLLSPIAVTDLGEALRRRFSPRAGGPSMAVASESVPGLE